MNSKQVLSARGRVGLRAAVVAAVAAAIALTVFAPLGSAAPRDPQPQVTLSPGALNFPDRPVGTRTEAQSVTLTNTGDAPLTISTFRLNGPDAGDFGLGAICPVNPDQLQPGASCTIYVSFTPDSPGPKSATLAIGDDAPSSPQTVELSGFGNEASGGTPAATVSPGTMGFGDEIVDVRSYAQSVTFTNSGTAPADDLDLPAHRPGRGRLRAGRRLPGQPQPAACGQLVHDLRLVRPGQRRVEVGEPRHRRRRSRPHADGCAERTRKPGRCRGDGLLRARSRSPIAWWARPPTRRR